MKIQVCTGKSCKSKFSEYIIKRIQGDKERFNLENVNIETCPCLWECKQWPNVLIDGKRESYSDPIKISKIILEKTKQAQHNKKTKSENKQKNDENITE